MGGSWVGRSWVVGRVCLKIKKKILAPSVLGPNLQLSAHELISPNSFYETLNKGKLSPITEAAKRIETWGGSSYTKSSAYL